MARNELVIGAAPAVVWQVLADPRAYGDWVVGSAEVREWDEGWPAVGRRLRHRIGPGPLAIEDYTAVLAADPPRRLVLRANARPLGVARIELRVEPHPAGALVTMVENPAGRLARLLLPLPVRVLLRLRNGESLRRLRRLAEAWR